MKLWESIGSALTALRSNKLRSGLTMLGVIIGVASIMLLVSLGVGARNEITGAIQGIGSNLIMVVPFHVELGTGANPMQQAGPALAVNKFTLKDASLVADATGRPEYVGVDIQRSYLITRPGKRYFGITSGVGANEFDVRSMSVDSGRFFTRAEVDSGRYVIVLGRTIASALFPGENPVDKYVYIKGRKFKVIGLQERKGKTLMMFDQDAFSWMPITTATRLAGTNHPDAFVFKSASPQDAVKDSKTIEAAFLKRFNREDFTILTQSDILSFAQDIMRILTYLLIGISSVSLVVGGIGIMNIMLVSVTERTREIGIRKAVGAKTRDILTQFLVEAIVMSTAGGLIGIALAWSLAIIARKAFGVPSQVAPWIVAMAFLFSAAVGVFFGVYPATKAAALDPIESLRYE